MNILPSGHAPGVFGPKWLNSLKPIVAALLASVFLLVASVPAGAQTEPGTGPASQVSADSPEALDALIESLPEQEVKNLLREAMGISPRTEDVDRSAPVHLGAELTRLWQAFTAPITAAILSLPKLPERQMEAVSRFIAAQGGLTAVGGLLAAIVGIVVAGLVAEFAILKFVRHPSRHVQEEPSSLRDSLAFLTRRFVDESIGLVIFYIVIRLLGRWFLSPSEIAFAAPLVIHLIWVPRLVATFSKFLLAPKRPDFRLVSIDDRSARFLHVHLVGLALVAGSALFVYKFNSLHGVAAQTAYWLDTLVYVYIAAIAINARDALESLMRGSDPDRTRSDVFISRIYPWLVVAVAIGTWALVSVLIGMGRLEYISAGAHYVTMFLLIAAPVFDTAVRGLVKNLAPEMTGEGEIAKRAYVATKRSYIRIGRVLAAALVIFIIARSWGLNLVGLIDDRAGAGDNIMRFLLTLIVGYIVFEAVSLWINRKLAEERTALADNAEEESEMGGASGSRLSTILPLILVASQVAICIVFLLLAIGNLGIDIAPLLAGAGVIGLAIGFGAQKLVADVVSGVFFLLDDAFRVGDYVGIEDTMGTVEKISVRSMQLRHHRGPVHTIPYGEIPKLTNYSRDWVIMKLKFTVGFDTDPNKVKKIFKNIGAEMIEDPLYKDDFLEPFKSQGVFDIDDVGMVIRGKFKAKPGKQFMIRKEIYNRVKKEFAENGIEFARREVRVALPDSTHPETEDSRKAVAAAAAASAASQEQDRS